MKKMVPAIDFDAGEMLRAVAGILEALAPKLTGV
jgi:hypothetical protein